MTSMSRVIPAVLISGALFASEPSVQVPISTNSADTPVRTTSGKVEAETDAELPPALGPRDAKVVVLVFSDFQCPVCRRSADATNQIAEEFPGEVRVEFWQHPLPMHGNAENAAVASLAAHRQGKFWEYHDETFRNQSSLDVLSLTRNAQVLDLDMGQFQRDYADPALRERVKSEAAAADGFAARSTPSFMVNGKLNIGWGSWGGFRSDVERELVQAKALEAQGIPVDQIAELRAEAQIEDAAMLATYREQVLRAASGAKAPPQKADKQARKRKKG